MTKVLETPVLDETAMAELAGELAERLRAPMVVFLEGDLGAGKTTFTRAVLRSLGYRGAVKSPTYGILEQYPLKHFELVHLDLYRIIETGELEFLGLDDLHHSHAVFMIEWPERGASRLPASDLTIQFSQLRSQNPLRKSFFIRSITFLASFHI